MKSSEIIRFIFPFCFNWTVRFHIEFGVGITQVPFLEGVVGFDIFGN